MAAYAYYLIKDILKRHKNRQVALENDVSNNFGHLDYDPFPQPAPNSTVEDERVFNVPMRRVDVVKLSPNNNIFSAPPANLPVNKICRKHRIKHTVRAMSPLHVKEVSNFKESLDLTKYFQSVLKNNHQSNKDSFQEVTDTFSYDVQMQSASSIEDTNVLKENEKPLKSVSSRKKPKVLQGVNISWPKVNQYDKVKEYINKMRERGHLKKQNKKMLLIQKRKEYLENLIKYKKQHRKAVAIANPLSPVKVSHEDNLITRKRINTHGKNILRNEHIVNRPIVRNIDTLQEHEGIRSDEDSKIKRLEEDPKPDDSEENQVSISVSHKRKKYYVPKNIPTTRIISTSVDQSSVHQITENFKNKLTFPGTLAEPIETASKSKPVTKSLLESSAETITTTTITSSGMSETSCVSSSSDASETSCVSTSNGISEKTSISTPSGNSVDPKLLPETSMDIGEEMQVCENHFLGTKQKKGKRETKKEPPNMIQDINERSVEPSVYIEQWLATNPFFSKTSQLKHSQLMHSESEIPRFK